MNTKRPGLSKTALVITAIALAGLPTHAQTPGASLITIETVIVGDIGNAADSTGYGSVGYEYQIGKYEVTNAQYAAFLNAVDSSGTNTLSLYNSSGMSGTYGGITWNSSSSRYEVKAGFDLKPVNYVSFYDAARFTNWLTTGNIETGVYNLLGGTATPSNGTSVTRTLDQIPGTLWAIASEDEWYKAAYYNGDGSYRTNPVTGTLSQSTANYYDGGYAVSSPYLTEVDHYDMISGAGSFYGTFQQGGNVREWNDTIIPVNFRGVRGGSFDSYDTTLASSARYFGDAPAYENLSIGFRVVALSIAPVPEPSTYALIGGVGAVALAMLKRRRRKG